MNDSAAVRLLVVANASVSDPAVRERLAQVVGDRRGRALPGERDGQDDEVEVSAQRGPPPTRSSTVCRSRSS